MTDSEGAGLVFFTPSSQRVGQIEDIGAVAVRFDCCGSFEQRRLVMSRLKQEVRLPLCSAMHVKSILPYFHG